MNIWQEKVPLRFASIDSSDRLTLSAAFSFFQEAAISHAVVLGVGRDALAKTNQAWILSRFSIFFDSRPKYEETLTVRSWPRGPEKLFALRDYDIQNEAGDVFVRGRGAWLVIDVEKRRPLRIEQFMDKLPLNDGINAFNTIPPGLNTLPNLASAGIRAAAYSDVDYFGHVNNVRYVQWILDVTPPDMLIKAAQMRLDINYLNEVLPGEKVELFTAPIAPDLTGENYPVKPGPSFAYEGRRGGSVIFRAELRLGD